MNLLSLYMKSMDPSTCAWVSVFVFACVCESECREDAVHSLAYARVRVSFYKDVGVYPSVLFLCVHLPLSSAGACSVRGPPSALPGVPATRGSEPGHSPRRRLRFRLLSWPDPPRTGRDTSQPPGLQRGKPLYRPREGGIPVTFPCVTPYALFHWLKV